MRKLFLLGAAGLLAACSKHDDAAPAAPVAPPINEATVSMAVTYYDNTPPKGISFVAAKRRVIKYSDRVLFYFADTFENELLNFTIPTSKLKTGVVGTYTLKSQPDPGQGDVLVAYNRVYPNLQWNSYGSDNRKFETGALVITAYDTSRQLFSGTYEFTVRHVPDPYTFLYSSISYPTDPRVDANLHVYGSFMEVGQQ